jgi:hypothetical protein
MRNIYRVATIILLLSGRGYGQQTGQPDGEAIQQLLQQVRELQQRVQALETERTTKASSPPSPVTTQTLDSELQAMRDSPAFHELHGIQWRGFGEVDYKVLNQKIPELGTFGFVSGSAGSFYIGDFDLLLTSRLNDKASVLAEVVFGEEDAQTFNVDLERALFKYDYNDHLRMSFGRYHTGLGYYNSAFHRGSWLHTTADRPLVMEFADDGGILPTQAVGVSVTGQIPSGGIGLNYTAEYGSSDTIRPQINNSGLSVDENNGNHINLGLFLRPSSIAGLQIGASFYHDKISDFEKGPSVRLGQTIVNAHVVYVAHGMEFLNEGFLVRHSYEASQTVFNMPAFYSQLSRRFARFRPFIRYQYINANQNSIFSDVLLRHGPSFGLRYDFNDFVAFKAQFDHMIRKDQPALDGLHLQLAFTF